MDAETAALLFGLARAQATTQEWQHMQEPVANLSRAVDYYTEAGDVARAVAVAAYPIAPWSGQHTALTQLISRALTLVPSDSHEAGRLLSLIGGIVGIDGGDYERSRESLGRALAIARSEKDVGLEMQTLTNSCLVDFFHARWQECVEKNLQIKSVTITK